MSIILQGVLLKKKRDDKSGLSSLGSKYQKRYFELTADTLAYAKDRTDFRGAGGDGKSVQVFDIADLECVKRTKKVNLEVSPKGEDLCLRPSSLIPGPCRCNSPIGCCGSRPSLTRRPKSGRRSCSGRTCSRSTASSEPLRMAWTRQSCWAQDRSRRGRSRMPCVAIVQRMRTRFPFTRARAGQLHGRGCQGAVHAPHH